MTRILLAEDEPSLRASLATLFTARGYHVCAAASGQEAIAVSARETPDVAVIDLVLGDIAGTDVLAHLRVQAPACPCIVITAHASIPSAVALIKAGAFNYLAKPFDNDALLHAVGQAVEHRRLSARVAELEEDLAARAASVGIVGRSPQVQALLRLLARAARTLAPVLIGGETGVGKELAARNVHLASANHLGPFVALNCAAIPKELAESTLFGHVRGAFTDAKADRVGLFVEAHGGTLFLDEVGDLGAEVQAKLLRVLQDKLITPVGAARSQQVNVRIIAATHRNLADDIKSGRFREDLYYRLNVLPIQVPPLRDRQEDLPLLIAHFFAVANRDCGRDLAGLTPDADAALRAFAWPGNIRQLSNALLHAVAMADGPLITPADLPAYVLHGEAVWDVRSDEQRLDAVLAKFGGNQSAAARALGINRRTLYTKIKRRAQRQP